MPAMVALMPTLPPSCSATMRVWLSNRYGYHVMQPVWSPAPWFEWNLRRERGLAALRSAGIGVSREAGVPRGSECDLGGF